jgi:hypothetical protein
MNSPGNLFPNSHLGSVAFGARNSRFDLLQFMLNFREVGLRHDAPFIRDLRTGFKPLDASFQGSAIDHPPEEDTQQGSDRGKEQQRINRSVSNSIA